MQQIINVPINGKMDSTTLVKLNNYTNQKTATTALYQSLWTFRLNWLKSLSQWSRYGKGWSNRMNELYERSKGMFTNPKFLGIFVLLGVSLFFLIKKR
jgi:lysozyme family protein